MSPTDARRRTKPRLVKKPEPEPQGKPVGYELIGLALITLGIMLLLSGFLEGHFFKVVLRALQWLFGTFGAWGVAVAFLTLGITLLIHLAHVELTMTSLGVAVVFLVAISAVQLYQDPTWTPAQFPASGGGFFGSVVACGLYATLGQLAWVVLIAGGLGGVALMTDTPLWMVLFWPFKALFLAIRWAVRPLVANARERRAAERAAKVAELQESELRKRNRRPLDLDLDEPSTLPPRPSFFPPKPAVVLPPEPVADPPAAMTPVESIVGEPEPKPRVRGVPSKEKPEQLQFEEEGIAPLSTRPYTLPPAELLTPSPKSDKPTKDDTNEKIAILEQTLSSFGIDGKVVAVERGPRVTRFEIVPPPGIRVNRITNLSDDIALSLAALDVRVEAPVPGKGVVGIEVPNKESVIVALRELVDADILKKAKSPLTFALGRDITGHPRVADLTKMPHLLIAGQTNSGKSVCINSLLCSLLMRATPQQVKLLLVDPKRVELSLYQHIPHLIAPVAYDAKHAAGLLRWAIREMEQRYEMFAEKGVRNIIGFNEQSRLEVLEELPYIVIVIDELADLMMQAAAEFEASICRIAQLARATGIHLVVATQRPSVNVITGTIKANIPSRISFAVASQVDSRTILDMNGAERLVGQGDMLYLPVDASKPARIQGAYVSEQDTNRIVDFVKTQGKPHFTDEIVAIEEESLGESEGGGFNDEPEDELAEKALEYIRTTKYASTSMLQRKFRIGYTRAARLMDQFEERGFVGPGQGSKPREVIFAPSSAVVGRAPMVQLGGEEDEAGEDDKYFDGL